MRSSKCGGTIRTSLGFAACSFGVGQLTPTKVGLTVATILPTTNPPNKFSKLTTKAKYLHHPNNKKIPLPLRKGVGVGLTPSKSFLSTPNILHRQVAAAAPAQAADWAMALALVAASGLASATVLPPLEMPLTQSRDPCPGYSHPDSNSSCAPSIPLLFLPVSTTRLFATTARTFPSRVVSPSKSPKRSYKNHSLARPSKYSLPAPT